MKNKKTKGKIVTEKRNINGLCGQDFFALHINFKVADHDTKN